MNNTTLTKHEIGGKAYHLAILEDLGFNVPNWFVVNSNYSAQYLNDTKNNREIDVLVKLNIEKQCLESFGPSYKQKKYAVRSSAIDEDGAKHSFAGMYESILHVPFEEISAAIVEVWKSTQSPHILKYRTQLDLPDQHRIAVIVQEMIASDVSGIAFAVNPLTGNTSEKVITAAKGYGDKLVSGSVTGETYHIDENKNKTQSKVQSKTPVLTQNQITEVCEALDILTNTLGTPQDIEFTFSDETLYLLQTRPITTIEQKHLEVLWDNSNIIESYPGISSTLTFSFIQKMYKGVYVQLVKLLGVSDSVINNNESIFSNTLGHIKGRVYYNLRHWYMMLAMVPGYALNAQFMETMMGVKESFELDKSMRMSKFKAMIRLVIMLSKMLMLQFTLPKRRRKFVAMLQPILKKYNSLDLSTLDSSQIIKLYNRYESTVLAEWKAPLVNDFFAMIWFGILKKQCETLSTTHPNLHNDLLCGSRDIVSVEPIKRTIAIVDLIRGNDDFTKLFEANNEETIWNTIADKKYKILRVSIDQYLADFGERCIGELKLETVSYSQKPALYIKVLKDYIGSGITASTLNSTIDLDLRKEAEETVKQSLKRKPLKKMFTNYVIAKARDLVSSRENLRYERTKAFGVVRKLFSGLGKALVREGILVDSKDIFHLTIDEINQLDSLSKHEIQTRLKTIKEKFKVYAEQPSPSDRFWTPKDDYSDQYIYASDKSLELQSDLKGVGCCPGVVQGRVKVITNPNEVESLNGDILVTMSTDPGWVTLFPSAGAIIVQRGSLLSHSAIVSREMGIPCIVGVDNITTTLQTGDEIIMDGSTGSIKILNHG